MPAAAHPLPEEPTPVGSRRKLEVVGGPQRSTWSGSSGVMTGLLLARTVTSTRHGRLREDLRSRQEFLALACIAT